MSTYLPTVFGENLMDVFDDFDRNYLKVMIEDFSGGPVGVESLAASLGYERDTLENVVEPYLIQQGFVQRTRTGRVATNKAYAKFGLRGGVEATE